MVPAYRRWALRPSGAPATAPITRVWRIWRASRTGSALGISPILSHWHHDCPLAKDVRRTGQLPAMTRLLSLLIAALPDVPRRRRRRPRSPWRLENPFRLFADARLTERHRLAYEKLSEAERLQPILSIERRLASQDGRGWARSRLPEDLLERQGQRLCRLRKRPGLHLPEEPPRHRRDRRYRCAGAHLQLGDDARGPPARRKAGQGEGPLPPAANLRHSLSQPARRSRSSSTARSPAARKSA